MTSLATELQTSLHAKLHAATHHKFTNELCAGTLDDAKLYVYLDQDQKFFMRSVRMVARMIQLCTNDAATVRLGQQLGFLCANENTYFERTLNELRSTLGEVRQGTLPEVQEFLDFISELVVSDSYVQNIVALYTLEYVYQLWAEPHKHSVSHLAYKHKEWVYLHSGKDYGDWVKFLESEMVRVVNNDNFAEARETMSRVLDLEFAFFESTYNAA